MPVIDSICNLQFNSVFLWNILVKSDPPPSNFFVLRVIMASDDIAQLADALAKTHVGDGELSFKGLGLKLDNAASGEILDKV